MTTNDSHAAGGYKIYFWVWFWLLLLTLVEVFFAYRGMVLALMVIILMGLSIMKSAMIMAYFMHLRFERLSLILTLIPALVILISLMFISFPDSLRIHHLTPR